MSNNNSILFVGIAAAVLLCGAAAGVAIACMNNDTVLTDEQIYNAKYMEGYEAGLADYQENGPIQALRTLANFKSMTLTEPELESVEDYAYWAGYYAGRDNAAADCNYQDYLDYYEGYLEELEFYNTQMQNYKDDE